MSCERCGSTEEFFSHICPVYFRCDLSCKPSLVKEQFKPGIKEKYLIFPFVYFAVETLMIFWYSIFFCIYGILKLKEKIKKLFRK